MKKYLSIILSLSMLCGVQNSNALVTKKAVKVTAVGAAALGGFLGMQIGLLATTGIAYAVGKGGDRASSAGMIAGALAGAAAAYKTVSFTGAEAMIEFIARKNNVSRRIAETSWYADVPINASTKPVIQAAVDGNKQYLKEFIASYYAKIFGEQWRSIVMNLIHETEAYKVSPRFQLLYKHGMQGFKLLKSLPIPYLIALLYRQRTQVTALFTDHVLKTKIEKIQVKYPEGEQWFRSKLREVRSLLQELVD